MKVLMVGVDAKTKGGMWSVARSYIQCSAYQEAVDLKYVSVATVGSPTKKILFFAAGFFKVIYLLITQKRDIVHIHMSERGSVFRKLIIARVAQWFGCKIVIHMHGAEFEPWYNGSNASVKNFVRNGLNSADCILILGEYWHPFISSIIEDERKIKVLYNAVSAPEGNRYQMDADNMLFLGEVGERKGAYDLLTALSSIDDQLDNECQLLIYGPNPDGDIVDRIRNHNLQHRAKYMGWADPSQFEELFAGIAVNILPSYNEGLPMTILETMAYGIPNISTKIAAIPEAINEKNGMLVQPGDTKELADAILYLLRNSNVRKTKSENAYRMLRSVFSTERHMQNVIEIYDETMKRGK